MHNHKGYITVLCLAFSACLFGLLQFYRSSCDVVIYSACVINLRSLCYKTNSVAITALLKQQGLNTKGILKGSATKEEISPLPNLSGKTEVFK